MALRRFLRLLAEARAAAAARGRAPSAAPSTPCWFACAAVRGQEIRACAAARVRAVCADGKAATTAARAFAESRDRDAYDYVRRAQRQAVEDVAGAGPQPWDASDWAVYAALRVLYGPTAKISERPGLMDWVDNSGIIYYFRRIPFKPVLSVFRYIIPPDRVSSAPEYLCPFLGVYVFPSEEYQDEKRLEAVVSLVATVGAVVVMTVAGLIICVCIDAVDFLKGLLDLTCQTVTDMIKRGKTPEQIHETFSIRKDFTSEEEEEAVDFLKGLLDLTCQTVTDMIKRGKTSEQICETFSIKKDFTPEEEEEAADFLKGLLDLTCQTLTNMIEGGKTPQQIRETFSIKKDFTPEEEEEAADFLKGLLDLTCQTLTNMIEGGKTPQQIREMFSIKKDFTSEEEEEAADFLKGLLDLTCQTLMDMIKGGKTPQQIRETFNNKNDVTPEEEEEVHKENSWAFE